ncbi:cadherin repeat domain-containing protein, partial [Bathymodiolus heckerae thiotrophic gill symbiont]|uniref:cadherin repeat domain-containing protein n=1 Tax=Bathymodiolus heckerae thiotrophic gill symbiont TaxID=1052212 RepID=UPI0010FE822F
MRIQETNTSYVLKVKISAADVADKTADITINITNILENVLGINNQGRNIAENSSINSNVGAVLSTTGTITGFEIVSGNTQNTFAINNTGQITLAKALDYEATNAYTLRIKITGSDAVAKEANVAISISNILENTIAFNNQQLNIVKGSSADTLVGTLALSSGSSAVNAWEITGGANQNDYKIDNNGIVKVKTTLANTSATHTIIVKASGVDADSVSATITINVINNPDPAVITNTNISRNEGTSLTALSINATNDPNSQTLTYGISGTDANLFNVISTTGVITFKSAPDYENPTDSGSNNVYNLTLEVNDEISTTTKAISITINNLNEANIGISPQSRNIAENSSINSTIGAVLITTGTVTNFEITAGNDAGLFKINNSGQIQVANASLDYETTASHTLSVKITGTDATDKTANITINITNTPDTALEKTPTVKAGADIITSINKSVTLTATGNDPDGNNNDLKYTWTQTTGINVALTGADTASASFTTTAAMKDTDLTFSVSVSDNEGLKSASDSITVKVNNAKVVALAVRKESKAANKVLLSKASKVVMSRLSFLRHKKNKQSGFNVSGFVNGIQVSLANSELKRVMNSVLSANGLNPVIKTPTRKLNRWDTWTSAKLVIGNSKGGNNNKTKFNFKSLNIGMDRSLDEDKMLGFSLGLGKEDRTATGTDFSGDIDTTQWT